MDSTVLRSNENAVRTHSWISCGRLIYPYLSKKDLINVAKYKGVSGKRDTFYRRCEIKNRGCFGCRTKGPLFHCTLNPTSLSTGVPVFPLMFPHLLPAFVIAKQNSTLSLNGGLKHWNLGKPQSYLDYSAPLISFLRHFMRLHAFFGYLCPICITKSEKTVVYSVFHRKDNINIRFDHVFNIDFPSFSTALLSKDYDAIDDSPLSRYVSQPIWNYLVELLPRKLAPNVLTVCGFSCFLFTFAYVCWLAQFQPESHGEIGDTTWPSRWVWLLLSATTLTYFFLDGMDGKQARRIDYSGPAGELLDHGLDSLMTILEPIALITVFNKDKYSIPIHRHLLLCIMIQFTFLLAHWERKVTSVFHMPWSADLSHYVLTLLYLLFFLAGSPKVLKFYLIRTINLSLEMACEVFAHGFFLFIGIPQTIARISKAVKKSGYKTVFLSMRHLISVLTVNVVSVCWAYYVPELLLTRPRLFIYTEGVAFASYMNVFIVAHLAKHEPPLFVWAQKLYILAAVYSMCNPKMDCEVMLVSISTAITVFLLHYIKCTVQQICNHLGMACFYVRRYSNKSRLSLK